MALVCDTYHTRSGMSPRGKKNWCVRMEQRPNAYDVLRSNTEFYQHGVEE